MSEEDSKPSEIQTDWQQLGLRLRMAITHTLEATERGIAKSEPDSCFPAEYLNNLANAALARFHLERHAASLDAAMQRERGWNQ